MREKYLHYKTKKVFKDGSSGDFGLIFFLTSPPSNNN